MPQSNSSIRREFRRSLATVSGGLDRPVLGLKVDQTD
jgi:hypothetical protein